MRRICLLALGGFAAAQNIVDLPGRKIGGNASTDGPPCRRKGAVFEAVDVDKIVLFSGKTKDEHCNAGHMSLVGDAWLLELNPRSEASWKKIEPRGAAARRSPADISRPSPRWKSGGAGLGNKLYVFAGCNIKSGGKNTFLDDLWVLDPATAEWTEVARTRTAPWPPARRGHVSAAVPELESFVVVGGRKGGHECLRDAWVYAVGGGWREASMPPEDDYACRWGHTATRVADGSRRVAVFGGRYKDDAGFTYLDDLWLYDAGADSWRRETYANAPPSARDHHAAAYLAGGLYVHGGKTSDQAKRALGDLYRYDLATRRWSDLSASAAPSSRYLHSAAAWPVANPIRTSLNRARGAVVVFGGEHIVSRKEGKKKYRRMADVWAFYPAAAAAKPGAWVKLVGSRGSRANLGLSEYALRGLEKFLWAFTVVACVALVVMALHFRFDEDSNRMVPGASSSRPRSRSASGEDSDLASPGFFAAMGLPAVGSYSRGIREYAMGE